MKAIILFITLLSVAILTKAASDDELEVKWRNFKVRMNVKSYFFNIFRLINGILAIIIDRV